MIGVGWRIAPRGNSDSAWDAQRGDALRVVVESCMPRSFFLTFAEMTKSANRRKRREIVEELRHRLRFWVSPNCEITDEELDEVEKYLKVDEYFSFYEYAGNYILTDSLVEREEHLEHLCCGIIVEDVKLDSGRDLYFAFDYGH